MQRAVHGNAGVSRSRKFGVLLILLLSLAMTMLVGCGSSSSGGSNSESPDQASFYTGGTPGGDPVRGGAVTILSSEAPTSLDPVTVVAPGSVRPSVSVFDTLAEVMPGGKEPRPALAKSWRVSPDARTYTFELRSGVEFSNGEKLNAEDVAFSLLRAKELPTSAIAPLLANMSSVTSSDQSTVVVKFSKPEPAFIALISSPACGIVPKDVVRQEGDEAFGQHPVGTGPFFVQSVSPDFSKISMDRNPRYWRKGMPYLDSLVYSQVENDNARILAVRSGSAQLDVGVPYSQISSLESTPEVQMVIQPIWGAWLAPINNTKPPLSDPKVRLALAYATPYESIIDSLFRGRATQANSIVGGLMKYANPEISPLPYDPSKAKSLLKAAGESDGFSLTVQVQGGETNGELLASILQSAWKDIGVDLSIETLNANSLLANVFTGKFELQIFPPEATVVEAYSPDQPLYAFLGGELFTSVKPSTRLKSTLMRALREVDEGQRAQLFEEVQRISYLEEPSWLTLINLGAINLASNSLRNYDVLLNGHSRMEEVWLAQ